MDQSMWELEKRTLTYRLCCKPTRLCYVRAADCDFDVIVKYANIFIYMYFAEAVWSRGRASDSEQEDHGFKSGHRQLSVILFRRTGRTLAYHLCSPHMPRPCSVTLTKKKQKTKKN